MESPVCCHTGDGGMKHIRVTEHRCLVSPANKGMKDTMGLFSKQKPVSNLWES